MLERQYPRPTAEVAPAINKMVGFNYGRTLAQDIPGGEIARGEIKGATAAGMRRASELGSGAEAYGALGQMVSGEQEGFANMAKTTAQQVYNAGGEYANSLQALGQEQNRVWDWNKAQPYLMAAQIASQLRGTGTKNIYSGVANVFGSSAEATSPDFHSSLNYGGGVDNRGKPTYTQEELSSIIKSITGK
jgi:hypothetical protein